ALCGSLLTDHGQVVEGRGHRCIGCRAGEVQAQPYASWNLQLAGRVAGVELPVGWLAVCGSPDLCRQLRRVGACHRQLQVDRLASLVSEGGLVLRGQNTLRTAHGTNQLDLDAARGSELALE